MNKINSKDVSIVVQGKNIAEHTYNCLKSLRTNFPDAEIIFSTYENEDIKSLDFDILVTSADPKATLLFDKMYNNINRILVTTRAGLQKVSRKYCLKIRSDLYFDNDKLLLDIASFFPIRDEKFAIFKNRVLFYCLWSRKFEYINNKYLIQTPFHLSDWMCFGLTEDIKSYFEAIPLTNEPQYSNFFKNPKHRKQLFFDYNVSWRFPPEQYFAVTFFSQFFAQAKMESAQDVKPMQMEFSKQVFASNVVVCGYKECGAYVQKKEYKYASKHINWLKGIWLSGVYRYADFLADYKKYCDKNFKIPLIYLWSLNQQIDNDTIKIHKHYLAFIKPIKMFLKWIEQFFSIMYYGLRIVSNFLKIYFQALIKKYFLLFLLVYAF